MSHQLPDKYWDSLRPNGLFLHELFHNQSQLVTQLQVTNNNLQIQMLDAPYDIANAASQAASAVAQMILTNIQVPTEGQLTRNAKAADPKILTEAERKLNSSSDPFTLLSPCRSTPLLMRG